MSNSPRIVFLCIRWPAHPCDENEIGRAVALRDVGCGFADAAIASQGTTAVIPVGKAPSPRARRSCHSRRNAAITVWREADRQVESPSLIQRSGRFRPRRRGQRWLGVLRLAILSL